MEHRLIMLVMCDFFVSTAPCVGVGKAGGCVWLVLTHCWVPRDQAWPAGWWVVVGCWVPLVLVVLRVLRGVAGAAGLFFENFTVDASIFVSSF